MPLSVLCQKIPASSPISDSELQANYNNHSSVHFSPSPKHIFPRLHLYFMTKHRQVTWHLWHSKRYGQQIPHCREKHLYLQNALCLWKHLCLQNPFDFFVSVVSSSFLHLPTSRTSSCCPKVSPPLPALLTELFPQIISEKWEIYKHKKPSYRTIFKSFSKLWST